MSKPNALAGLIGNYGDSDEEDDETLSSTPPMPPASNRNHVPMSSAYSTKGVGQQETSGGIHPAPIPHCPWTACYDEGSGFTYYWNQHTNAVTWEAPPEYILALKLAQQQLNSAGSTEVSAEEWQLYQQALAEKENSQNKAKTRPNKPSHHKPPPKKPEPSRHPQAKRKFSVDDDVEKIELITSYHNSDSESNDEPDSPVKKFTEPKPVEKTPKSSVKKQKTKPTPTQYGPPLPPNQNYTVPIGPELPPGSITETVNLPDLKKSNVTKDEEKKPKNSENEDSQDENTLLKKLKDKAKLLEKLGGEIPSELQKLIEDEEAALNSPKPDDGKEKIADIDDLLQEIEKKELPKAKTKQKIDMFDDAKKRSPKVTNGDMTPPLEEMKPLFPSSKNGEPAGLFPSAVNIQETIVEKEEKIEVVPTEKKANVYLMGATEVENVNRKKLWISNSVLPERKKADVPSYTTKYSQHIDGFSGERTGLGFSKDEDGGSSPKKTISYGNGLTFTKGEVLNEDKKDEIENLEDAMNLLEAKLKYLNELQPSTVTPVQEMYIQMQTLRSALMSGGLSSSYWREWGARAHSALARHEAAAAPAGWLCAFQRSEGRYQYKRESDGLVQWEYPATANMDMDISTTPPHPGIEDKEVGNPPLPPTPPRVLTPPPPACWGRVVTPPPPAWADPPPPGCDDPPPLPPEPKQEIGDELASFYNDIAELEKTSAPHTATNSPEPPPPPTFDTKERDKDRERERDRDRDREREKEKEKLKDKDTKVQKKKSKVKISSSMGLKHKSVSNLVAKWQQVADEINSD